MKKIIFACVHNAGRSQMAAAFFNAMTDPEVPQAISTGTEPGTCVHPEVVDAMQEVGIDLSRAKPQRITDELARSADLLITMGCGDACPFVPGLHRQDWPLSDPKGQPVEMVREIRDEIRSRIRRLLAEQGWSSPSRSDPAPDRLWSFTEARLRGGHSDRLASDERRML